MKRSKFSEEQVVYAFRQAESGTPIGDLCRQYGGAEQTFYAWKKKYAHLGVSELRWLRQLKEENSRLKQRVADLTLDKHMLSEALRKKSLRPARRRALAQWFRVSFAVSCAGGLSVSPIWARILVPKEHGQRSDGPAAAYPRSRACASAVRLSAHLGIAPVRGLGGQPETGPAVVPPGWAPVAHASSTTEAQDLASGASSGASWAAGAVEHGFRA
jgi:putative transposase